MKAVVKLLKTAAACEGGSDPQVLAGVRNLAINWLCTLKIAQALHENGWNLHRLFAMLGKPTQ